MSPPLISISINKSHWNSSFLIFQSSVSGNLLQSRPEFGKTTTEIAGLLHFTDPTPSKLNFRQIPQNWTRHVPHFRFDYKLSFSSTSRCKLRQTVVGWDCKVIAFSGSNSLILNFTHMTKKSTFISHIPEVSKLSFVQFFIFRLYFLEVFLELHRFKICSTFPVYFLFIYFLYYIFSALWNAV